MIVSLPIELKAALTYFITQGIKAVLNLVGKDMEGFASAIAAVAVGSLLFFIEGALALVPAEYLDSVSAIFALAVSLLSAFGLHYTVKSVARPA